MYVGVTEKPEFALDKLRRLAKFMNESNKSYSLKDLMGNFSDFIIFYSY